MSPQQPEDIEQKLLEKVEVARKRYYAGEEGALDEYLLALKRQSDFNLDRVIPKERA